MGIRKATTAFFTTPSFGRTLAIGGMAGAGATALAHLINMPEEEQALVAAEAADRGLTPVELIVGALVGSFTGDYVDRTDKEHEQRLQEHADSPESRLMVEDLKSAELDKDVTRKRGRLNTRG